MDYPLFTYLPDFSKMPMRRTSVAVDVLNIAAAKQWLNWPDTQPQTVTQWTFSGETDTERAQFTGMFEAMGGRAGHFLMPSYDRDLTLAALPAFEDTTITLEGSGYGAAYLGDSYPDRDGRYVFILCPKNGVHITRVLQSQNSGETSILTVEQFIPWDVEAGAMIGFARICRFEVDELEMEYGNEQHWSTSIATRTVRIRTDATRDIKLTDGVAHLLWKPLTDCHQELKTAARTVYNYCFALGPVAYATPQSGRPASTWAAWVGTDGVYLAKRSTLNPFTITDGDGTLSRLTDKAIRAAHLSLAFDENCNEVIAFSRRDETMIEIRGLVSDVVTKWTFEGFSPQLFQFWTIDNEAYDLIDAEIVCIYAKRGQAGLFGRFESEDFATEHLLGSFPNVPLRIEAIEIDGTDLSIICIDDSHREMVLRASYDYLTSNSIFTTFSINYSQAFTGSVYIVTSINAIELTTVVTGDTFTEVPTPIPTSGLTTGFAFTNETFQTVYTGVTYTYSTGLIAMTTFWLTTVGEVTSFFLTTEQNTTH